MNYRNLELQMLNKSWRFCQIPLIALEPEVARIKRPRRFFIF
jgi:hypothetical protein